MSYTDSGGFGGGFAMPRMTEAVKLLLIINAVVFVANAVLVGRLGDWFGVSWPALWEGFGLGLVRLVTYQFVHDFYGVFHILMNLLLLYFFGTMVEDRVGKHGLVKLYIAAGVVGAVVQILLGAILGDHRPMVGASGAVYGIMVYAACMAPRMRVIFIVVPVELRILVGLLLFVGLYSVYVELVVGAGGGVAHGGHLGGALWGYLAYKMPQRNSGLLDRVQGWKQQRDQKSAAERQAVLDELLEKVHREGIGALTPAERRFLDKTSQDMRRK